MEKAKQAQNRDVGGSAGGGRADSGGGGSSSSPPLLLPMTASGRYSKIQAIVNGLIEERSLAGETSSGGGGVNNSAASPPARHLGRVCGVSPPLPLPPPPQPRVLGSSSPDHAAAPSAAADDGGGGNGSEGGKGGKKPSRPTRRGDLPPKAVATLKAWLLSPEHINNPYPTPRDQAMLLRETGIDRKQLRDWFVNARRRIWKPMIKKRLGAREPAGEPTVTKEAKQVLRRNNRSVGGSAGEGRSENNYAADLPARHHHVAAGVPQVTVPYHTLSMAHFQQQRQAGMGGAGGYGMSHDEMAMRHAAVMAQQQHYMGSMNVMGCSWNSGQVYTHTYHNIGNTNFSSFAGGGGGATMHEREAFNMMLQHKQLEQQRQRQRYLMQQNNIASSDGYESFDNLDGYRII